MDVTLRDADEHDAPRLAEIYAPYVRDTCISFELEPPSAQEMRRRQDAAVRWLVACEGDTVVGYACATPHRERAAYRFSVDVAIYLDATRHRQGLGRRLYGALFDALRAQGYVQACAGVTLPNPASVGLHEALGFQPVGIYRRIGYKQGAWHDVGWWQLELQTPPAPQPGCAIDEPRPTTIPRSIS